MTNVSEIGKTHAEILEEAENLRIDSIAQTMDIMGVTPSIGRLYGIMYLSEEPMTLDSMSEKTGLSKPRMSTSVHSLLNIKHIHKVWKKGERKDLYEAEKDFFKTFISFYCSNWEREYEINMEAIEKALKNLDILLNDPVTPIDIKDKAQKYKLQFEESKSYFYWLQKLVKVLRSNELLNLLEES